MCSASSFVFLFQGNSQSAAEQEILDEVYDRSLIYREQILSNWSIIDRSDYQMLLQAMAALRLNTNTVQANQAIQNHAVSNSIVSGDETPDFYPVMQVYARLYYMFSGNSVYFPGRLTPETEAVMKEQMWQYVRSSSRVGDVDLTNPLTLTNTENHDIRRRTAFYFYSFVLKGDPAYKDRPYGDGQTAEDHYIALNEFYKKHLEAKARNGLWVELGSSTYAKFNFAAMLALADFAPDETVRMYARMNLDLTWIENAQISFGYDRGGGKCRLSTTTNWSWPQTDLSSEIRGGIPYLDTIAPLLFGEMPPAGIYTIDWAVSLYQAPEIAVLIHRFGSNAPPYEIVNKVLGETVTNGSFVADSRLVNYTYKTPNYMVGGLMFDPAAAYAPISADRRWAGLIFNDANKTRMAPFPEPVRGDPGRHYDAFWHVQHKNVMVGQKYKSFRVDKMRVFIPPGPEREEAGGWVFVNLTNAFAAVRPAYGGYAWDCSTNWLDTASGRSVVINFNEEWAPMIFHAGDVQEFGSYADFKNQILNDSVLTVTTNAVMYEGSGQPAITFYHAQTNAIRTALDSVALSGGYGYAGDLILPQIGGGEVNLQLPQTYQSPFLVSVPGEEKIRTFFGARTKEYDFGE